MFGLAMGIPARSLVSFILIVALSAPGFPVTEEGSGAARTIQIPAGTEIDLELLHHLNSKYSPTGSKVHLRVVEDLVLEGAVVVARGTLAQGTVREANESEPVGRAGSLSFSVHSLKAVDGTPIPLEGDVSLKGRQRAGAAMGMVMGFGVLGFLTRGRMAYEEKGTVFSVRVQAGGSRILLSPGPRPSSSSISEDPAIRAAATARPAKVTLLLEKGQELKPLELYVEAPQGHPLEEVDFASLELVRVDDTILPDPVPAAGVEPKHKDVDSDKVPERLVRFDAWKVLAYCSEGPGKLFFRGNLRDGAPFLATADIDLTIRTKAKKG